MTSPNNTCILLYTDPADNTRRWQTFPNPDALDAEVDRINARYPGFADMDGDSIEDANSTGWLMFNMDSGYDDTDPLPDESESDLWYVVYTDTTGNDTWAAYEDRDSAISAATGLRTTLATPVTIFSYDDYTYC